MNAFFVFFAILFFGFLYIWIGFRASKGQKTNEDYFLMGRKLSFFPLCMTLLATQVGGGSFIGAAEEAYRSGWIVLIYPLGAALGLCVLGLGFGAKLRQMQVNPIAELFERVYGSPSLRYLASALSILSLFLALVGQGIAAQKFFVTLGLTAPYLFVGFWLLFVAYTVMGGLKAVIETDVLQALIILAAVGVLWGSLDLTPLTQVNPLQIEEGMSSFASQISWFLMPLLFMLIEQDMGQRCFAARTPAIVRPAAIISALLLLGSSAVTITIGILAKQQGVVAAEGETILVAALGSLVSPAAGSLFIAAIFMAIASTADSLLCSIGSNITYDFILLPSQVQTQGLCLSRWITFFTGLAALVLVFLFDNILSLLIFGYSLCVCTLFVPIVMAILSARPSPGGAYGSVVGGGIGLMLLYPYSLPIPSELLALSFSLLGFGVGQTLLCSKALEVINEEQ
ncbi:MAG: sodium:solute symporter family protein [Chlamydiia bacterium]|nr:sodium:solute symporter family protein [Chlamydiia bacterium]